MRSVRGGPGGVGVPGVSDRSERSEGFGVVVRDDDRSPRSTVDVPGGPATGGADSAGHCTGRWRSHAQRHRRSPTSLSAGVQLAWAEEEGVGQYRSAGRGGVDVGRGWEGVRGGQEW